MAKEIVDTLDNVTKMADLVCRRYGPLWGCNDDHVLSLNAVMLKRLLVRAERAEAALAATKIG